MARPVWTGTISFGMVSLPVRLVPAVRRKSVSFNQLDAETMSRIRYRKVSDATGEDVPAERIVRAANLGGDQYVVVTDDELSALAPARSKEIVIDAFVPSEQIDPVRYDASFHITPDSNAKPYALLAHALGGTDRVGVGRFVMRQREHLAAIRSDGDRLQLSTLVFDDELVDADSLDEFDPLDDVELSDRELEMAGTLVEAMSADVESLEFVDEYRVAVESLIEQKAAGETPVSTAAPEQRGNVIDLAQALEASLEQARAAKHRHPSAGATQAAGAASDAGSDAEPDAESGDGEAPTVRQSSRKAAARKAAARKRASGTATATKPATRKATAKKASATKAPSKKAAAKAAANDADAPRRRKSA
jgi:DNA end-binding protein Ku